MKQGKKTFYSENMIIPYSYVIPFFLRVNIFFIFFLWIRALCSIYVMVVPTLRLARTSSCFVNSSALALLSRRSLVHSVI